MCCARSPDAPPLGLMASLLGPGIASAEGSPERYADMSVLSEAERRRIASCVARRQREYAATRVLARQAFRRLGHEPVALLNHEDGSPRWPEGVVGSVTHTRGLCAVAVSRCESVLSLGIDAESDAPLKDATLRHVVTESELSMLGAHAEGWGRCVGSLAKLVFSAKESVYKAQYPLTRAYLGFQEVEVEFDWGAGTFFARVRRPLRHAGSALPNPLVGCFAAGPQLWGTAVTLSADGAWR